MENTEFFCRIVRSLPEERLVMVEAIFDGHQNGYGERLIYEAWVPDSDSRKTIEAAAREKAFTFLKLWQSAQNDERHQEQPESQSF